MATTSALGSLVNGSFTVDQNGKLKFSGVSSGLDWQSIVDAQVAARRAPAYALEAKVSANTTKIQAYNDFKGKVQSVVTALDKLRASPGSPANVFNTKSVSGSTTAVSGTASDISSLLAVAVTSAAQNGSHTITVNSLATAHQVRADQVSSTTATLDSLGIAPGTFSINGKDITVSSSDTLLDVRAKINNSGAGVNATVVSADANTHYLVITSQKTGTEHAITFGGDPALTDALGLTENAGVDIKNELVEAKDANIDVDGVTGIIRSSNEIDDVIAGFTFSLLKAEPGTTINLKVETDLTSVKTVIYDFVEAYNDVRAFVTAQRTASDRNNDGKVDTNELGPLAYDQTVRDILSQLGDMAVQNVGGAVDGYASLAQIGIVLDNNYNMRVDDSILDNKLLTGVENVKALFAFGSTTSDSRATVLGRGSNTASGTYTIHIAGTDANGNLIGANYGGDSDGSANGTATVSGRTVMGAGPLEGLNVFFNGGPNLGPQTITVTVSRGLADQFYDYFDNVTRSTSGLVDTEIIQLQGLNEDYKSRVQVIDVRLELVRSNLEAKYAAMEAAMAQLQTLQKTIESYTAQANRSNG